jgi:hypothetical protein
MASSIDIVNAQQTVLQNEPESSSPNNTFTFSSSSTEHEAAAYACLLCSQNGNIILFYIYDVQLSRINQIFLPLLHFLFKFIKIILNLFR